LFALQELYIEVKMNLLKIKYKQKGNTKIQPKGNAGFYSLTWSSPERKLRLKVSYYENN